MNLNERLTITDVAPRIRNGKVTPSEILHRCLEHIDHYEGTVRAWATLDRDRAIHDANVLTDEIHQGRYRGPLHGIPIGIKDIIDVADMPTGCGSLLWAKSYARTDANCVKLLRQAGALILGKTITTPFAFLDPPVTRSPWKSDRTPGGSSSGSAAAVASGMCFAALGSQTGGSTTRPASYCGVASLKPSFGKISVGGIPPLAPSLDHVGIMANSVNDVAVIAQTIARSDPTSIELSLYLGSQSIRDTSPISQPTDASEIRLVRLGGYFEELLTPELRDYYFSALKTLHDASVQLLTVMPPPGFAELPSAHRLIMAVEAASVHHARKTRHPNDYPPHISKLIEEGLVGKGAVYFHAKELQKELTHQFNQLLQPGSVFITPATTDFAPSTETTGNPAFNVPWGFTGLPTVSIPVGQSDNGLPYAIQLIGRSNHEHELFAIANLCESVFQNTRQYPWFPCLTWT